jgi:glyoxalase family protein
MKTAGLHHVTAIAGPAQRNLSFYTEVLGLRLTKKTVNFDDPGTYHLYYGDNAGSPGSILTFFPFSDAQPGLAGAGMTSEIALTVAEGSLPEWSARFADALAAGEFGHFNFEGPSERLGDALLRFRDPDGLPLALVERAEAVEHGGFHSVTLSLNDTQATGSVLENVLGLTRSAEDQGRTRFAFSEGQTGFVDLVTTTTRPRRGAGTVHHIAFRARDEAEQLLWQERVASAGIPVTEVKDRQYFRSIYFREPGGVLFEIATDPPGFTVDEPLAELGQGLKLPSWLESKRATIEARLPALQLRPSE